MVERSQLHLAAQCLEKAAVLAPDQDYIKKHLSIVQSRINHLPPEQRESTEIFDDSFLHTPIEEDSLDSTDPANGQFLGKTDVMQNHIGSIRNNQLSRNNYYHIKRFQNQKTSRSIPEIKRQFSRPSEIPNIPESAGVLENVMNRDTSELEFARHRGVKVVKPN
ncbi:uncharacterized protein LOC107045397 [Diachasma alloeum]|uniref:uncharacterized protein LOC107045397 n=1 Tax=Diachasma alloeum TaxID=454923 RepID=UPI0007381C80|nr:uncharacterized protein LOC107045397 [Diachasma alloeum]